VREVRPVTVVEDADDGLVVWLAPETPMIRTRLADGRRFSQAPLHERYTTPVARRDSVWGGAGIIMIFPPAVPYSVWLFWDTRGNFLGWYGNLEDPHVRWERGVDSSDLHLDVCVSPNRVCEWLDEDEFAVAVGLPDYWTEHHVPAIRAAGERLMEMARDAEPPFDGRYVDFEPDPAWPVPELPDDWDAPRHYR
jgi:hypothetical protein